jgi:two-component system OmpR family response regulator/two-component system phosphate regulon response regulator OmpR
VAAAPLVLIVDDDSDTREMYGWCLKGHGFRVALASTATAALASAASEIPDVLITDYTLPGGDGCTLADTLRRAPQTAHVLMVLVSGRDFVDDARLRTSELFDRVFLKPVLPDDLVGEILPLVKARAGAVHAAAKPT